MSGMFATIQILPVLAIYIETLSLQYSTSQITNPLQ